MTYFLLSILPTAFFGYVFFRYPKTDKEFACAYLGVSFGASCSLFLKYFIQLFVS